MGMGYGSNVADTITEDNIRKIGCGEQLDALLAIIEKHKATPNEYAEAIENNESMELVFDDPDANDEINEAYEVLQVRFHIITGLDIGLAYHNSDANGSCYDDVDGRYWYVKGVWQRTPEATKIEEYLQHSGYVTFG